MEKAEKAQKKILLLGVGNILLGDEGAGVHVVNRMKEKGLPENVEAVDCGTLGPVLLHLLADASRVIIIDCVDAGAEPGSIFRLRPTDILPAGRAGSREPTLSCHEIGLPEALALAEDTGQLPETVILGIQPRGLDWGTGLSSEVERRIPCLIEQIRQEFKSGE